MRIRKHGGGQHPDGGAAMGQARGDWGGGGGSVRFRGSLSRRSYPTLRVTALRILFDKNVPVGVRRFLLEHEVHTVVEMGWPDQLENGELLKISEESGFDVMVTSDQNIRHQQN